LRDAAICVARDTPRRPTMPQTGIRRTGHQRSHPL